jgi:hypothetical protein
MAGLPEAIVFIIYGKYIKMYVTAYGLFSPSWEGWKFALRLQSGSPKLEANQ